MPVLGNTRYLDAVPTSRVKGTLVLLHAFPLDERLWEPQLALAEQGWRVVAPRMHGSSMDEFAADVVDLLDALGIDGAMIGGLSMGGYAAFALYRRAARYFQGMLLADTRSQADTPEGIAGRRKMLALVAESGPPAIADEMIPKLLGETTRRERPEIVSQVRGIILEQRAESIVAAVNALMTRPDSTPLLSKIDVPTLVVVGAEDTLTPPPLSEQMQAAIRGAQLAVVPAAGHLSSIEQPAAFNAALTAFLETRL
jgi:3-oxoadipate enol-lactonase